MDDPYVPWPGVRGVLPADHNMYAGAMAKKLVPVGEGAGTFTGAKAPAVVVPVAPTSRPKRTPPLTDAQRLEAAGAYRDTSVSIRQLAERFGVSYGTMHRVLTEAGVQMRGRNGK